MNRTELKLLLKQFAALKRDFREKIDYAAHMAAKAVDDDVRSDWVAQYNDLSAQYQQIKHITASAQTASFQRWMAEHGTAFFAPKKVSA